MKSIVKSSAEVVGRLLAKDEDVEPAAEPGKPAKALPFMLRCSGVPVEYTPPVGPVGPVTGADVFARRYSGAPPSIPHRVSVIETANKVNCFEPNVF